MAGALNVEDLRWSIARNTLLAMGLSILAVAPPDSERSNGFIPGEGP